MATVPKSIQEIVRSYVKKIEKQIPIKKAMLFGSYAKGNHTEDSDIDIAIFSDYFDSMKPIDSFRFLFLEAMDYDVDLQPQAFTLNDLYEPKGIVENILKDGIEINKLN